MEACIEAAQKSKVEVVMVNRRQLDVLVGNNHHKVKRMYMV